MFISLPLHILAVDSARLAWSSAAARGAGCRLLPIFSLPPSGRGPGVYGPTQHSGHHLPVLIQGRVNGTIPPPSLYDVQEQAHTPSTYITGPHLAAQVSRNEVFIRSSPVPTKSQRLRYLRKEARPWGTPHRCCLNSASPSAHQPTFRQRKWEGARDKSLQEDCDSELITSAREFLG